MSLTVLADSSTLIGLSKIGQLPLLSGLFKQVTIPSAVYNEVVIKSRPDSKGIKKAEFLKVENVKDEVAVELLLGSFGRGEAEVLTLAREKRADIVLIDEKKARKAARRAGFTVVGILGVLIMAKEKNLIQSVKPFIEELCKQGFRLSKRVIENVLREIGEINIEE